MVWNGELVTKVRYVQAPPLNTLCLPRISYLLERGREGVLKRAGSKDVDRYVYTMLSEALLAVVNGHCLSIGPSVEEWVGQVWRMRTEKSWSMRTEKSCSPIKVKETLTC